MTRSHWPSWMRAACKAGSLRHTATVIRDKHPSVPYHGLPWESYIRGAETWEAFARAAYAHEYRS